MKKRGRPVSQTTAAIIEAELAGKSRPEIAAEVGFTLQYVVCVLSRARNRGADIQKAKSGPKGPWRDKSANERFVKAALTLVSGGRRSNEAMFPV